jgi:bifunctional DNase/RNase
LFFWFRNTEPARLETKVVADLTHQIREHSGLMGKLLIIVSVHKNVFVATVTVQIQVKYYFTLFLKRPD